MNMLPIFIIGLLVGIGLSWAWYSYKRETPSEARLHIQEAELIRYQSDLKMYHDLVDRLYKKIAELKNELEHKN